MVAVVADRDGRLAAVAEKARVPGLVGGENRGGGKGGGETGQKPPEIRL